MRFRLHRPTTLPFAPTARHVEPSFILSADDDLGRADDQLIALSLEAINAARSVDLEDIASRNPETARWIRTWPGEHYRLLAGFMCVLHPRRVVEVGTATGASALCMAKYLAKEASLTTFDVVPWQQYPGAILSEADFGSGQLRQEVSDLTRSDGFGRYQKLLEQCDFFFLDAAKDGQMERRLFNLIAELPISHQAYLVFDDIRVQNMLSIWREINRPKLDLTSFGHWSGTGLVRLG